MKTLVLSFFLIEGTSVEFNMKDGLLVKGCEKECIALTTVKKHPSIDLKEVRKGLKYAGAVGSDVCHEIYKAKSLFGKDESTNDQKAFCYFSDGSMIEIGSLSNYLTSKKIVR